MELNAKSSSKPIAFSTYLGFVLAELQADFQQAILSADAKILSMIPGNGRTTNDLEGFFSIFKRGMRGVYQFCNEKHLHRYLAEFDFRYSNRVALGYNDADRADTLLKGVTGKRLTYQTIGAR